MSKLAEFKALEARIAEQMKQLDSLRNDKRLKKEIEFETKLAALMTEYGVDLRQIIAIIEPQRLKTSTQGLASDKRKSRALKVYKNPETGDFVQTKGGNHKILKEWKKKFGIQKVESWLQ